MASGSYRKRSMPPELDAPTHSKRTTDQLPAMSRGEVIRERTTDELPSLALWGMLALFRSAHVKRHLHWFHPFYLCVVAVVLCCLVLVAVGNSQRPGTSQLVLSTGEQVFPVQVGGSLGVISVWQQSTGPLSPKKAIPAHSGPYAVLGPPSLSVAFMNSVLAYYNSPAAGKGQALYDDGVKYGIDPAYALAFFMHESSFGTAGVARVTLSLSNMRCVPAYPCFEDPVNGGYAQFSSWEQGFEAWFKLIRNLYVAQWGLVTLDQIIPTYAPSGDHNDVAAYVAALKHTVDTWRAGIIQL